MSAPLQPKRSSPTQSPKAVAALKRITPAPDARRRAMFVSWMVTVLLTTGLLGVLLRVAQLQSQPSDAIAELRSSQRSSLALHGRRGSLLDRQGRLIAGSRPATRLFVDPAIVEDVDRFVDTLADKAGYPEAELKDKLTKRPDSRYVVIEHELPPQREAALSDVSLYGLGRQTWLKREYPNGSLAGQIVGFVGFEGQGLEGVERLLDSDLQPESGRLGYLRDSRSRAVWLSQQDLTPSRHGQAVHLTLDLVVQAIAEEELARQCLKHEAESGQVVVMDVKTGQILAMANYPFFDPADLSKATPDRFRNRAVTDAFEPGSIFKPFVWSLALDGGWATPEEMIDTTEEGRYVSPEGRRLKDTHGHGVISWEHVLVKSSNIGMAIVGQRMGNDNLYHGLKGFGFGESTRSGLPGEIGGIVNPLRRWNHYSETSVPMGQELAVTGLQITRAFAAIANGGWLVQPTIIMPDANTTGHYVDSDIIRERAISTAAAERTKLAMRKVVEEGTGRRVQSDLYQIFGKTGTAQIAAPNGKGYLDGQYVASFIGGAPLDEPRIVVGSFVHRPNRKKGYYGGTVSGPVVKAVVERTLSYLGVASDVKPETEDDARLVRQ